MNAALQLVYPKWYNNLFGHVKTNAILQSGKIYYKMYKEAICKGNTLNLTRTWFGITKLKGSVNVMTAYNAN